MTGSTADLRVSARATTVARWGLLAGLAAYGFVTLRSPGTWRLLDGVDLAIHETGHLVFAPFGEYLAVLGGTLLQLLFPLAFVVHFLRRREPFAAAVALWWLAQSFWNVSVYVGDARAQELPLVGGGEHDWAYLLGEAGRLHQDRAIARLVHAVGALLYMAALALGALAAMAAPTTRAAQAEHTP